VADVSVGYTFIFVGYFYFMPDDEKALARNQMIAQSYPDGKVWEILYDEEV